MNPIRHFDAVDKLMKTPPKLGAEIGVHRGDLSLWLMEDYPELHLLLVDRWTPPEAGDSYLTYPGEVLAGQTMEEYSDNLKHVKWIMQLAEGRVKYLVMDFVDAAKSVDDESLDFVYLDADHSRAGTFAAIQAWAPKVRVGGVVGGHDWGRWGVSDAVYEYRQKSGVHFEVTTGLSCSWGYIK